MTKVCHFLSDALFLIPIFPCKHMHYVKIQGENLNKEVDCHVNKKWLITTIIAIVVILVGIVLAVGLSYEGDVAKKENLSSTAAIGENEVTLDYSLRLKQHREYPLVVEKDQEMKMKYNFKSVDNAVKVIVKSKETNEEVHSFFIDQEKGLKKGTEKIKMPAGEYTIDVLMPSLSKGKITLQW